VRHCPGAGTNTTGEALCKRLAISAFIYETVAVIINTIAYLCCVNYLAKTGSERSSLTGE
jgi:hypothetical protein